MASPCMGDTWGANEAEISPNFWTSQSQSIGREHHHSTTVHHHTMESKVWINDYCKPNKHIKINFKRHNPCPLEQPLNTCTVVPFEDYSKCNTSKLSSMIQICIPKCIHTDTHTHTHTHTNKRKNG